MFFYRLIFALGVMTCAYFISEVSEKLARRFDRAGRPKFLVQVLVYIHFFSAVASLFVGLYMYYHHKRSSESADPQQGFSGSAGEPVLPSHESCIESKPEAIYYMEAANGMTVPVPESKLEAWQAEQDRIRNDPAAAELTEDEKKLCDAILHELYRKGRSVSQGSDSND